MKIILPLLAIIAIVAAILSATVFKKDVANRDDPRDVSERFVSMLTDTLPAQQIDEIEKLFDRMWERHDQGKVDPLDVGTVVQSMNQYLDAGRVGRKDLVYLMAQVGYFTLKLDPRYQLEEGYVDHPVLNPDAAVITFLDPDSVYKAMQAADSAKAAERE